MSKDKLIKNVIDLEFLSHLIFFPEFNFEMYKHLNFRYQNPKIIEEFKEHKCKVIIGFSHNSKYGKGMVKLCESDLAFSDVSFYDLLRLIGAC